MKVVTLLNEKGGVGKTTLATHIAAGLAIKGNKVVLVDADAQGHSTIAFGLKKEPGFYDLIVRGANFNDVLRLVSPERFTVPDDASSVTGQLFVLPSNIETRSIATNISDGWIVLKRIMELRGVIDFVIIDTAPTPSLLHSSIYMATDGIIYPTKPEAWSFDGLRESFAHKDQVKPIRDSYNLPDIQLMGIVPTMFRGKTLEHQENVKILRSNFGDAVWTPMPIRTIWAESASAKRTVYSFAPGSQTEADAWQLVEQFLKVVHVT